jgi:putative glycosyltransferase (TIGR04372 family)
MRAKIYMLLALPIAGVIYSIRPLLRIRIGRIDAARLGFMAFQPDVYFFNKSKGSCTGISFFYFDGAVSNQQLKRMWGRTLLAFDALRHVAAALSLFPQSKRFEVDTSIVPTENYSCYFKSTPPPVRFTATETEFGLREMQRMGIPQNADFFCFTNRDTSQFQASTPQALHENSYRNFSIDDLQMAVRALTEKGLHGVRVGGSSTPLSWGSSLVHDYASLFRTDFMDIFLLSKCRFFMGPNSGPYVVSELFRRPVAMINAAPLLGTNGFFSTDDVFIPKKYRLLQDGGAMTLGGIMASGAYSSLSAQELQAKGVELVPNTPTEVKDLALEIEARLSGTWKALPEDSRDQETFQRIIRESLGVTDLKIPRVGAQFLRENPHFLR